MIRNETEYQEAVRRLDEEAKRLAEHEVLLKGMGLRSGELKRALDPLRSFHLQLAEEVESYERLKRGELGELTNLVGLGRTFVALRIALGLTQRELAERLGSHESQVSRDERNEYHGITVERASRILDALQVHLTSRFDEPIVPRSSLPPRSGRRVHGCTVRDGYGWGSTLPVTATCLPRQRATSSSAGIEQLVDVEIDERPPW